MAYQKGLNSNKNHHDSLSQSGNGRTGSDNYAKSQNTFNSLFPIGGNDRPYGQGKHSGGGKPKQFHF